MTLINVPTSMYLFSLYGGRAQQNTKVIAKRQEFLCAATFILENCSKLAVWPMCREILLKNYLRSMASVEDCKQFIPIWENKSVFLRNDQVFNSLAIDHMFLLGDPVHDVEKNLFLRFIAATKSFEFLSYAGKPNVVTAYKISSQNCDLNLAANNDIELSKNLARSICFTLFDCVDFVIVDEMHKLIQILFQMCLREEFCCVGGSIFYFQKKIWCSYLESLPFEGKKIAICQEKGCIAVAANNLGSAQAVAALINVFSGQKISFCASIKSENVMNSENDWVKNVEEEILNFPGTRLLVVKIDQSNETKEIYVKIKKISATGIIVVLWEESENAHDFSTIGNVFFLQSNHKTMINRIFCFIGETL